MRRINVTKKIFNERLLAIDKLYSIKRGNLRLAFFCLLNLVYSHGNVYQYVQVGFCI